MITLTVTSFKGAAVQGLSASLDELGGTIGRAETNQLVLPDPERGISRIHAQIVFRGGAYALIGRGANPVLHKGAPVGVGSEVMLANGDQIDIGDYRIAVSIDQPASRTDPFEAAFGDAKPAARATPAVAKTAPGASRGEDRAPTRAPVAAAGKPSGFGIPDDWDPFAQDAKADPFGDIVGGAAASKPPGPSVAPGAGQPGLAVPRARREDSLDALFGLSGGAPSGDPLAASKLASAVAQPNTGAADDPLRSLQQAARPGASPVSDHASDLNAPWVDRPVVARTAQSGDATALPGAVLSWDSSSRAIRIGAQARDPAASAPPEVPRSPPRPAPASGTGADALQGSRSQPSPAVRDAELMQALLEGLGTPELRTGPMSPDLMRLLGQLLRESTKGTVELLAARAALKREVRAEVTMIIAKENNALKFSPNVEVALQYMLGPKMSGFMPSVESMRDAYDDLRAHQLGIMAGMKAALAGVLERFDPTVVEGKLTGMSALASLMPSSRKARLWELFQELYQQLAKEAEEDFNALFGAAFLAAYQQYIDQLKQPDGAR